MVRLFAGLDKPGFIYIPVILKVEKKNRILNNLNSKATCLRPTARTLGAELIQSGYQQIDQREIRQNLIQDIRSGNVTHSRFGI